MTRQNYRFGCNRQGRQLSVLASLIFSPQKIAVKWVGGDYSVLEIVTFRSFVALLFTLLFYRYLKMYHCPAFL
jgi:hypothetical protein